MSHEIRTPLNAVLGMAQIGRSMAGTDADRARFDDILRAGEHLLGLVNDVLDMAHLESGRLRLQRAPVALPRLLEDCVGWYRQQALDKGLELHWMLARDLPETVWGDDRRLRQILINLLSNALKFTDHGEISVRAASVDGRLRLQVSDTGIGMDAATIERLFTPFEQGDVSLTRRHGGSGLGLAISRELARRMGGDIAIDSAPGRGSTFTLSLPMEPAQIRHSISLFSAAAPSRCRCRWSRRRRGRPQPQRANLSRHRWRVCASWWSTT